jgi:Sec-independent protein translocase protein TatA
MGLGTELPILLALGFVVLGPKRMQTMLDTWRGAKAELHKASPGTKSQLPGEIKDSLQDGRNNDGETSSRARHREDGL